MYAPRFLTVAMFFFANSVIAWLYTSCKPHTHTHIHTQCILILEKGQPQGRAVPLWRWV